MIHKKYLIFFTRLVYYIYYYYSKTQRYLDGRQLVKMPARTIEWKGFDLSHPSETFLFRYLECFAADALKIFLDSFHEPSHANNDSNNNTSTATSFMRSPHYSHIRNLLALISRCLTHPKTIQLRKLDHLRRMLLSNWQQYSTTAVGDRNSSSSSSSAIRDGDGVQIMSAEQVCE